MHKRVLITGATSGIGEAFARLLPTNTDIFLTGRNTQKLEELAQELKNPDRKIVTLSADIAKAEDREKLVDAGITFQPDLFINNAGLGATGPLHEQDAEYLESITQVNVVATTMLTRRLFPSMLEVARKNDSRCGMILVSSVVGFLPVPKMAAYSASKGYNLYFGEAFAEEMVGYPADILTLCPGSTDTRFSERAGVKKNNYPAASAETVAREGLRQLGRKRVHVVGATNRIVTVLPRFLPRRVVAWIAGKASP